jgi:hypothetical protein
MNNFTFKLSVLLFILFASVSAYAQPVMSSPTVGGITSSGATLGGTIAGAGITARGTSWKTSAGVAATDNQLAEGGTTAGTYTHARSGMPAGTQIFFVAYGTNGGGTAISSESSFYTLSTLPLAQPASFTATTVSATQINLAFTAANDVTVAAAGYVIYRFHGTSNPTITNVNLPNAATAPASLPDGSTLITTTSNSATTFSDNTVTANNEYHYAIVPFGYNGSNAATYDYLITSYPVAIASTNPPTINSPTATSITDVSAVLGGTVTSSAFNAITERGTVWKTTAGAAITDNKLAEGGTTVSSFSHSRTLPAATHIFYKAYVTTAIGTALSSEASFYTLETSATGQPASFTAASASATSINLTFSDPATVGADGYIILRKTGSTPPDATGIANGTDPAGNDTNLPGTTTRVITVLAGTTTYTNGSLATGTQYSYTIIPFTFNAISTATYNYLTSGGLLSDSDTPSNGISITTQLSGTVCQSVFSSLSNLVITESSKGDFTAGSNRKLVLGFSGSGYIFEPNASLTATFTAGNNITSVSAVADYSSITITYSLTGTNKTDMITISGIKAQTSNSANAASNISRISSGGSDGVIAGGSVGTAFGTISSGSKPATPVPSYSVGTGVYCSNSSDASISAVEVLVTGSGLRWFQDASLSTEITGNFPANLNNPTLIQLGFTLATPGTYHRYVTITSGCQSDAADVTFVVNPVPTADAGADETVANGNKEVCSGTAVSLGGSPTLSIPSVSGSYSYSWSSTPSVVIASTPNPAVTLNNATASITSYTFTVTVTDVNLCSDTDSKDVEVKPVIVPQLTQPNSTTFGTSTPPVQLVATPAGGIFSGVGVVKTQTSPDVYKFSAVLANDPNLPPNTPQTYPLYYTVTDPGTGCTVTDFHIADMTLSNQLFSNLSGEYCSSEHSIADGDPNFLLRADATSYANIVSSVNYWNDNTRFYYGPLAAYSSSWYSSTSYLAGDQVHYNGEAYTALAGSIGAVPSSSPGLWQLIPTTVLKVSFKGTVRNYYEGYYGGNVPSGSKTILATGNTYTVGGSGTLNEYEMLTNANYKDCPTCDYSYPAFYLDFNTPADIQYLIPTWSASSYYYPGSVVLVGGTYYRLLLTYNDSPYYSINQDPTLYPTIWQSTGSNFDSGSQYKDASGSGFYTQGQFVTVHKNPLASFTGLSSGLVSPTEFCNSSTNYTLIGNSNGQFGLGNFDMSYDNITFQTYAGLIDGNPSPGQATFNGSAAYLANSNPSKMFYVRYRVDPGTKGSDGITACYGTDIQTIHVNNKPAVSFVSPTPVPSPSQFFCFNQPAVDIAANSTATITLSGFGVTDVGGGIGKFDPATAFTQLSTATGLTYTYVTRPSIDVTATATDVNGCSDQQIISLRVNPLPPASVAPYSNNLCYTTTPFIIDGQQTNAYWKFDYTDLAHTDIMGSTSSPQPDINTFNPKQLFDDAVQFYSANSLATLNIDLTYTTFDPDFCLNSLVPVTVKIAPKIPVTIAGINDSEEFCSNLTPARQITLSPTGGTLSITRNAASIATPTITNDQFFFSPIPLSGGDYVFVYDVITGNNCSNPTTVNVKVLPSPIATFTAPPKCEGDVISFTADGSQNVNGVPTYTWTLEGGQVTGQSTSHQFSSVGTYTVNLNVNYPPAGTTNTVCTSSLSLDQYVGLIPSVDFDIADVCSGDATRFSYTSSITPISHAQWDFGDGNTLAFGSVNDPATGASNTTGTFGNPIHSFSNATTYTVTLTGRTSDLTGACADTKTRSVSILEYLKTFGPANPYSMKSLHNEDGFWVVEDKRANTTWEFAAPSSANITSSDKSWVTNAAGYYKSNDLSFVNSPCLDLSAYSRPSISINYRYYTDAGKDGAVMQYSTDGGASWTRLGDLSSGLNWYTEEGISAAPGGQNTFGWSGTNQEDWQEGKHSLNAVAGSAKVRFRIAFASDDRDTLDGFAFNDVKIEERNRLTLIESFTNVNAANAGANQSAFQAIPETEVVKIEYYTPAPGEDPNYLLNTADFNSRAAFYGLTNSNVSIPRGFIDGVSQGTLNAPWAISYQPLRSLVNAPLSIAIENPASANPDELTAKVTLTALSDITSGKLDLQIAVIEKQVGSDKYVLRKLLPSAAGTRLSLPITKGATVSFTESWSVRNINAVSELAIVAFVQDQTSLNVLQAAELSTLTNLPTVVTGLGEENGLVETIKVYPNPANRDFTIQIPSTWKQGGAVKLADQLGKVVHESSFSAGSKTKTIATRDLAEGLYILKLESGNEKVNQKVMIVH